MFGATLYIQVQRLIYGCKDATLKSEKNDFSI